MKDWKEVWPDRVSASGQVKRGLTQEQKTEVYVHKARKAHNNKYTYLRFIYLGATEKSIITCPIHGDFEQTPSNHINHNKGCPKCAGKNCDTNEFIRKSTEIHGSRFDYSNTKFALYEQPVEIHCRIHGPFQQTPRVHLQGSGCPTCGGTKLKTLEQFIVDARKVHGDRYAYTDYTNAITKCRILCTDHGEFLQTPHDHLSGKGCPRCSYRESTQVYILHYSPEVYKIGITVDLFGLRLPQLEKAYGSPISVVKCKQVANPKQIEQHLLTTYINKPILDRKFDGYTELRVLTEQEVAEICSFLETI